MLLPQAREQQLTPDTSMQTAEPARRRNNKCKRQTKLESAS